MKTLEQAIDERFPPATEAERLLREHARTLRDDLAQAQRELEEARYTNEAQQDEMTELRRQRDGIRAKTIEECARLIDRIIRNDNGSSGNEATKLGNAVRALSTPAPKTEANKSDS